MPREFVDRRQQTTSYGIAPARRWTGLQSKAQAGVTCGTVGQSFPSPVLKSQGRRLDEAISQSREKSNGRGGQREVPEKRPGALAAEQQPAHREKREQR